MNLTQSDFKPSQYTGYYVTPKSGNVNIRKYPGTGQSIILKMQMGEKGGNIVALFKQKIDDYNWYYIKLKKPVNGVTHGFVATTVIKVGKEENSSISKEEENKSINLFNDVVKRDIIIYKRLITAYWVLVKLQQNGKNVDAQLKVLHALAIRLGKRQNLLRNIINDNKTDSNFKVSTNAIEDLNDYNKLRSTLGLGVIPIVIVIVVLIVAVSVGATLLIQDLLKPAYDDQTKDLKLTGAFGKYIKDLPDGPEKDAALKDIEKQIDDAYNAGLSAGSSGSSWAWIKTGSIVVLSVWGFTKFLDMSEKWRKKSNDGLRKT